MTDMTDETDRTDKTDIANVAGATRGWGFIFGAVFGKMGALTIKGFS